MLIIPDGIVKENKIYGERLRKAVVVLVVSSLKQDLQNQYLHSVVKFH